MMARAETVFGVVAPVFVGWGIWGGASVLRPFR